MTADDFTKMLLLNKFKEFIELIEILKIEISSSDSKISNNEISNSKFNNDETSSNNKNNENFVANYYKEADEEVSQF